MDGRIKVSIKERMLCPECGNSMSGAGKVWSGRNKKQMWVCKSCGRRKVGYVI